MRKVRLEFGLELLEKMGVDGLMKDIDRLEGLALLKLAPDEYAEVWKVRARTNLNEIAGRFGIAEVITLREEDGEVICLVKGRNDFLAEMLREYDVYYEYPGVYEDEDRKSTFTVIGKKAQVNRLLGFFKSNGIPFRVLSVSGFAPGIDPLGALTRRQREVLQTAFEGGYFDSPRRKTAREIAAGLKIKHSTFLEHLRKAQKKILNQFL